MGERVPQHFDLRAGGTREQKAALSAKQVKAQAAPAVRVLSAQLGTHGVLNMDPLTDTPRQVARLDGMLTDPSAAPPRDVVLGYLRQHIDVFHLSDADLGNLRLARDYVDITGIHHLSFEQTAAGLTLFGNGVKANVAKDGSLINVSGSPQPGLAAPATAPAGKSISGEDALRVAKRDTAEATTTPGRADNATPVLFETFGGTRRAWRTVTMSSARPTLDVIDAETAQLLYRAPLSSDLTSAPPPAPPGPRPAAPASPTVPGAAPSLTPSAGVGTQYANVVDNYPGAPTGGDLHPVSLNQHGWLPKGSVVLYGNNVHTYADVNANNQADPTEEIAATGEQGYRFPLNRTNPAGEPSCVTWVCTWDPGTPYSWRANESRTATQNFYFINVWHDHLQAAPIGFTEAAGNFQQINPSGQGLAGDPVLDEPLDGADTADGLPDPRHINNANFGTPPDGQSPRMQMYLFHQPGKTPAQDLFPAVSGSDDATVVFHEYTHGLSHRLIVDATNTPALGSHQGPSMGEGWSDWYAEDYLVNQGYLSDTAQPGDVLVGPYVSAGKGFRSEPMDCPVGSASPACPGTPAAGPGGYTYGDLTKISTQLDPHADGEIWAQTLWDIRTALGSTLAESLVTRGMELSPTYPSMLDMRNAILQADQAVYAGTHTEKLWSLFAARGMGFFAGSITGDDLTPVESFSLPPAPNTPRATLRGTVTDQISGTPIPGAIVGLAGHDSGFPGSYSATTDATGTYTISGVFPGIYPNAYAQLAGYNPQVRDTLTLHSGANTVDWQVRRDWAAASGGAGITASTGHDYSSLGCGPAADIDQSQGSGWVSDANLNADGTPGPDTAKNLVIKLPTPVNITSLAIDPSNNCGLDPSSATGDYKVETSTDGTTFHQAALGTFTRTDLGKFVTVTPTPGTEQGIQYVKFWMLTPQAVTQHAGCPSPDFDGCKHLSSTEINVLGTPTGNP